MTIIYLKFENINIELIFNLLNKTCGKCALSIVHTMHCLDPLLILNIELIIINNNLTLIYDVRKLTIIVPPEKIKIMIICEYLKQQVLKYGF